MTNERLRQDIIDELDFEPSVDAAQIDVAVDNGIVTLTGPVQVYGEKVEAREIVESVRGVRAVIDEVEVHPTGVHVTADGEIAKRILNTFAWNTSIPDDRVHVAVQSGWVRLDGQVEWRYQADAAARAVHWLSGVVGVDDFISVKASVKAADVSDRIRKALLRDAELDASGTRVTVRDGTVTLEGTVRYLGERKTAERAAWSAPGVSNVVNLLSVQ